MFVYSHLGNDFYDRVAPWALYTGKELVSGLCKGAVRARRSLGV